MKVVSLEDIGNVAGVSRSTVCRALANSPRVKLETRQRIQKLAEELGYVPNAVARGLITKRTHNFGIMVLDLGNSYIAELAREIDRVAQNLGYRLILSHRGPVRERALASINLLLQQRVDAIIVPDPKASELYLPLLDRTEVPVVVINKRQAPYPVSTDNLGAAKMGVDYLQDLGHERIAYIGTYSDEEENEERWLGYQQSLLQRSITPDPSLSIVVDDPSSCETGWRCMMELLSRSRPTAVFCHSDLIAIGAIGAAHASGLDVPGDISIVGFDGIKVGAYASPPLTTVAQQKERLAELSVQTVLSLIAGEQPVRCGLLPGELITRGSSAPPRDNGR